MPNKKLSNLKKSRGVLNLTNNQSYYQLKQYKPSKALQPFIEQFWHVTWDLRNRSPLTQQNLPQPNIHFTIEGDQTLFYGPVKSSFTRTLIGQGSIFGIKFHIGALSPLLQQPLCHYVDKIIELESLLEPVDVSNVTKINAVDNVQNQIKIAEAFLQNLIFNPASPFFVENSVQATEQTMRVRALVELIENDHSMTKVSQLVTTSGLSERAIQRIFKTYVGLNPKWLIRKYRIHELLTRLETELSLNKVDWQQIVHDLGYVDQAHLFNEFKSFVGHSPQQYLQSLLAKT